MRGIHPSYYDINDALTVLFGVSHRFHHPGRLPGIASLKQTFRRRSLAAHPDRALALGRRVELLTKEFQDISCAYRLLLPLVEGAEAVSVFPRRARTAPSRKPPADFFWEGRKPPTVPLRFAQYVYYRGLISYRTLIRVLARQMRERPRVGEIARENGVLTHEEVQNILREKQRYEQFLRAALRLGLLDGNDCHRILFRQRSFRLPIGEFFVNEGLLTRQKRDALLAEFFRHNHTHSVRAAS